MTPKLCYLVLDFLREDETRRCLESIKRHTKFPHTVVYLHNGPAEYPKKFLVEGLVDKFIQTKDNTGLGLGTRDIFASSISPYSFYLQNDQFLNRNFTEEEFENIIAMIGQQLRRPDDGSVWTVQSVDLAGGVWGLHNYTERAHIIPTDFYRQMEHAGLLGHWGAGPYDDGPWREAQIQEFYKRNNYLHYTYPNRFITNFGHRTVRQSLDGSIWEMEPDTKKLRLIKGPVTKKASWPRLTDEEWEQVLLTQQWPDGKVPDLSANYIEKRWDWGKP